ncbi:MAG: hypothetical protein K9G11_00650 [Rickettsiaceae bacterium]|nr:hypothetical protein [Rickettsiaceae bacterium]
MSNNKLWLKEKDYNYIIINILFMQFNQFIAKVIVTLILISFSVFSSYAQDNADLSKIKDSKFDYYSRLVFSDKADKIEYLDLSKNISGKTPIKKSWFDIKTLNLSESDATKLDGILALKGRGMIAKGYFDFMNFNSAKLSLGALGGYGELDILPKVKSLEDGVAESAFDYKENLIWGLNASMNYSFNQNAVVHMEYYFLSLGSIEDLLSKNQNTDLYKMDFHHNLSVGVKLSM